MPSIFHSVYVYNTCCVKLRWNSARFFFLNTLAHIFRYLLQTFNYYIHIVYNKDRYSGFLFNLAIWNLHLYNKLYVTVSHWISTSESGKQQQKQWKSEFTQWTVRYINFFISNFLINSHSNLKYIYMYYIEPVVKLKECMYIYIYSILQ